MKEQFKLHHPASLLILTTIIKEFHLCCTQTRERDRGTEAIYNFTFLHIPASEKTAEIQLPILWHKSNHESSQCLQKSNLKKTTTQQDITWPCLQKHQELHFSKESSCHHHPGQHGRQMKKLLELLQHTATRISRCLPQVCKTMLPPRPGI